MSRPIDDHSFVKIVNRILYFLVSSVHAPVPILYDIFALRLRTDHFWPANSFQPFGEDFKNSFVQFSYSANVQISFWEYHSSEFRH